MDLLVENYYDAYDTGYLYNSVVIVYKVELFVKKHFLYPLIVLNVIGNSLNIFVYSSKAFKKTSIGFWLYCLAVSDVLNTYGILYFYVSDIVYYDKSYVKVLLYIYTVVQYFTPAITTMVAIDRFIGVCYPNMIYAIKTRRNQLIMVSSLFVMFSSMNAAILFQKVEVGNSKYRSPNNFHVPFTKYVYPYLNIVFVTTLPFLLMLLSNLLTFIWLKSIKKKLKKQSNDRRFLITTITLNVLFLVFYLPRYAVEFTRIAHDSIKAVTISYEPTLDYNHVDLINVFRVAVDKKETSFQSTFFQFVNDFYNYIIFDKLSIVFDYWKYLYSTVQFIVYMIVNRIYRREVMKRLIDPYRKYLIVTLVSIIVLSGLGFLIFYVVKTGAKEFCLSTSQCRENMKCVNTKCICDYNTLVYNNNTCKYPSNASLDQDFGKIFSTIKSEILITELPESILIRDFKALEAFTIVNINGSFYNYFWDTKKSALIVYDVLWRFQFFFPLKVFHSHAASAEMFAVEDSLYIIGSGIFKCDFYANILVSYNEFGYDLGYFNKTDKCIYAAKNNENYFDVFDSSSLKKLNRKYQVFSSGYKIRTVVYTDDERLYVVGNNLIMLIQNNSVKYKYKATCDSLVLSLLVDQYANLAYTCANTINIISYNMTHIVKAYMVDNSIQDLGFDVRNKLVITKSNAIVVFN